MSRRLPLLIALAALAVGLAATVNAAVGPLVLASAPPNPFAACTIGGPGTLYANAEVEPWVAVNPTNPANPANVIGVYQQDRWNNGGARGLVAAVSHDGGLTWTHSWAHFSRCSGGTAANGGDYDRASDPWVTFSPNGNAYQIAISFNANDPINGVLVSKSTTGGDTWSEPVTLIRDTSSLFFNDKESITADSTNSNYVYAVWDRLRHPGGTHPNFNAGRAYSFRGDIYFSRTTDGGATWEPARALFAPQSNKATIGNQIVVLPNGTLVDIFALGNGSGKQGSDNQLSQAVIRSVDHGATWSQPIEIASDSDVTVRDPDTGDPVRAGTFLSDIAADPSDSHYVYAVWADGRFSGRTVADVVLSRSTDGGLSWSDPIKVSQTPAGVSSFTPSVHVTPNHTVGVTYYDFRYNTPDPNTLPTDYWIAYSTDHGVTWGGEQRITPASFDMRTAPSAGGFFTGDYEGLSNIGNAFVPFFVQANSGNAANRTDAFFTTTP